MVFVEQIADKARARLVKILPDAPALEAATLFHDGAEMILACREDGRLSGVVTKSDLMRSFVSSGKLDCTISIASIMQKEIVVCELQDTLKHVWQTLRQNSFRHLPVEDRSGNAIGILSACDILGGLLDASESEEEFLKEYVMGIGYR
ncbi:CBS domain-containing protein [Endobacterium cereale]|uniref:CBS domain-containing protein n=1 Tax=Endobacterium cereale TaxID=2663029 RepID=UPI002B4835E6|nr:CBS domain-containing protein [Endobacterium cereale]MEB2848069.1 CBS domain-containing protein [Endobacterium cereale]